jgi:glucokinase
VAGALGGETVKLTNSPWIVRPATLPEELGLDQLTLVNDFGAMAHAADALADDQFERIAGPARSRPSEGIITVIGPGTGLGVAMVLRRAGEHHVIETEGGHMDFAPLDAIEEQILQRLRNRFPRVSIERVVSGPGLANVYEALAAMDGAAAQIRDDAALWAAAVGSSDPLASAALDRFCMSFGSVAGDVALVQGASTVVITGQLSQRIVDRLREGAFVERFLSKGRYRGRMEAIPILLCRHSEPGLYGAAAAFGKKYLT